MIFVTGGTGLVGAHLLYELTSAGKNILALKRKSSDLNKVLKTFSRYSQKAKELFHRIEWVEGELLDYFFLEKTLKNVKEIYHCAGIVSFRKKERSRMISFNVEGTANLVDAALENGIQRFCHVSSIAALGRLSDGEPVTEETNWVPSKRISGYSESKFFSEAEIWRGMEEGMDAVIVNPSIIFGPSDWNSGSAKMFKAVWDGLKFYTKGITGFVDVRDVSYSMISLMDNSNFEKCKNQRYILNAENLSYKQVFSEIADALDRPRPRYYSSDLMLAAAWRIASLAGWLTGKPSPVTRDAVANSNVINNFDGSKICNAIGLKYRPVSESIIATAQSLKMDMSVQSRNGS